MEKFLERVSADLWERYGEGVSDLKIIIPNIRTRVFFVEALSRVASRPIFSPEFLSIDSLMCRVAGLERVDSIAAITELYKIYSQHYNREGREVETFDSFYHWGQVLLNDYDAVDKYMVDARMLFTNIADLKDIDASPESYLGEEQIAIVKRFWQQFDPSHHISSHKEKFISVWEILLPTYEDFRERLLENNVGYTGMIYRRAAELLREHKAELPEGNYVVIGFNALSATEKELFDHLKTLHEADFYWDWDEYYLDDEKQEAGLFVRENIKRYPSPSSFHPGSSFVAPKQINVISTASDSLQCKYVDEFVDEVIRKDNFIDKDTAIILTDEGLLSPLLYSLPDSIENVNVTMGCPLRTTLSYTFTERLLQLQQRSRLTKDGRLSFYHKDVIGLLGHPYILAVDGKLCNKIRVDVSKRGRLYVDSKSLQGRHELLDVLFSPSADVEHICDYVLDIIGRVSKVEVPFEDKARKALRRECFGLITEAITKADNSLRRCQVEMKLSTYVSLVRSILQGIRIPYSGEPLSGVQVMGILETRNLDFKNVLLLSMNDDNFPSGRLTDVSFIPYNLRYAYGMPTPQHNEGVYAYYFYRLLQRAERVDLVYCSAPTGMSTGEQSRYIYQLDFESPHKLRRIDKGLNVNLTDYQVLTVEKKGDVWQRMQTFLSSEGDTKRRSLSPSAFNTYMECPLKFYFSNIAGLRTEKEVEVGVDNALFGEIFHKAAELLYEPIMTQGLSPHQYLPTITREMVHDSVVEAITIKYFGGEKVQEDEYGGNLRLVADTVEKYINDGLIPFDSLPQRDDFRICHLEKLLDCEFFFDENRSVKFYGYADRVDKMPDGSLRIVDYKTGSLHKDFAGLERLLSRLPEERNGAAVQTFLYALMISRMQRAEDLEGVVVTPSLYYIRYLSNSDYSPLLNDTISGLPVTSYDDYAEEFERRLGEILVEMFSPDVPFRAAEDNVVCSWCDFNNLCHKPLPKFNRNKKA